MGKLAAKQNARLILDRKLSMHHSLCTHSLSNNKKKTTGRSWFSNAECDQDHSQSTAAHSEASWPQHIRLDPNFVTMDGVERLMEDSDDVICANRNLVLYHIKLS